MKPWEERAKFLAEVARSHVDLAEYLAFLDVVRPLLEGTQLTLGDVVTDPVMREFLRRRLGFEWRAL